MLNIRKKFQMLAENSLNHFLPFANICTVASFLASYESYTKKKKKKKKEKKRRE
jgi:phosphotransferase system  glucose/maltose/N-acetylglucosamine-specific IIC component